MIIQHLKTIWCGTMIAPAKPFNVGGDTHDSQYNDSYCVWVVGGDF